MSSESVESADPTTSCIHEERSNRACSGVLVNHKGASYCQLHYPEHDRVTSFLEAFEQKIAKGDFNFRFVIFPLPMIFDKGFAFPTEVDFSYAVFTRQAIFEEVIFQGRATFLVQVFVMRGRLNGISTPSWRLAVFLVRSPVY